MAQFKISDEDWNAITELSREARNTPVMALSVADGLAGRDFASMARERVFSKWHEIGRKMGFDSSDIIPVDEKNRIIEAEEADHETSR